METDIPEDKEMLSIYKEFINLNDNTEDCKTSPWIIRMVFDKEKMMEKSIIMEDIYISIMEYDSERIKFVFSDDNSKEIIGRVSIITDMEGTPTEINGLLDQSDIISKFKLIEESLLTNVVIKGIPGITNIVMDEETFHKKIDNEYNEDIISEYESMKKKKDKKKQKELESLKEDCKMWVFDTDGVNILNVLNSKYVDELSY